MQSYQAVQKQRAKLETLAAVLRQKEVPGVIEQIQALMVEYGLTTADLEPKKSRTASRTAKGSKTNGVKAKPVKKGSAKYRDPASGKTWSGKGKAPQWIAGAIKDGTRDRFLISPGKGGNKSAKAVADTRRSSKKAKLGVTKGGPKKGA